MTPRGVVGVYVNDGRVVASATDFDMSGYGGHTLEQAQTIRVKGRLSRAIVNAYCSSIVSDAIDNYECDRIVSKLPGEMKFIPVGHDA